MLVVLFHCCLGFGICFAGLGGVAVGLPWAGPEGHVLVT